MTGSNPCKYGHTTGRYPNRTCIDCGKASNKKHREANREKVREGARQSAWKQNNMPKPTRPRPDKCEICGNLSRAGWRLGLDHDNTLFRGWLCATCNLAVGQLGDSIAGLRRALNYLVRAYK